MKDSLVFKRGQVWFLNDKLKNYGSIQGKSRPYLVVSNDMCNAHSPVIHMAPFTTQEKTSLPTHVTIYDPTQRNYQTIMLEQTMPKSVPDIAPIATYKYTLTEDKMKEVDKALATQFGLSYSAASVQDFEALLDILVESKIAQIKAEADKINSSRAENYVNKLLEAVDNITLPEPPVAKPDPIHIVKPTLNTSSVPENPTSSDEVPKHTATTAPKPVVNTTSSPIKSDRTESQVDKFNRRLQKSKVAQSRSNTSDQPSKVGRKTSKWTDDLKKAFVADVDDPNISKSDILTKYDITENSYRCYVSKFRIELREEQTTNNSNSINVEQFLKDYDTKPISEVVRIYGLKDKKSAVALASDYKLMLEGEKT